MLAQLSHARFYTLAAIAVYIYTLSELNFEMKTPFFTLSKSTSSELEKAVVRTVGCAAGSSIVEDTVTAP